MREVKGRVYNTISKEFTYFDTLWITFDAEGKPIVAFKNCVASKTMLSGYCEPQWFINLKDKSGKPVFEGDIITVSMSHRGGVLPHRGEIVYNEEFGAFGTKNLGGITLLHNHCLHTLKVIGDIYNNPELLKNP